MCIRDSLKDWTKHGPAFVKAFDGKFFNLGCKSGSILTEVVKGKQVIKKINGKYFMYWGEEHVFAATSDDLIPVSYTHLFPVTLYKATQPDIIPEYGHRKEAFSIPFCCVPPAR